MYPNSCNTQGGGAPQFGYTPNQMQPQNQPNTIRYNQNIQGQTPGFYQPHGPTCECRALPNSNFIQTNPMMGGGQGMMSPNFGRPTQHYQNPQHQQRMMQQMFGMPQQGGNNQFGQNVCPNMQRNMNQNAVPQQQQPFNMGFNSY